MGMLKCEKNLDSEGMISLYVLRKRLVKLRLLIRGIVLSSEKFLRFKAL